MRGAEDESRGLGEADASATVAGGAGGAGLAGLGAGEYAGFSARGGVDLDTGHGAACRAVASRRIDAAIFGADAFGSVGETKTEETFLAAFGGDFGGVGGADAAKSNGADGGFTKASIAEAAAALKTGGAGFAASTVGEATAKGGAGGGLEADALGAGSAGFTGSGAGAFPDLDADGFGAVEADTLESACAKASGVDLIFGGIELLASSVLLEGTGPTASTAAAVEGEALCATGASGGGAGGAFFEAVGDGATVAIVEADADVIVAATFDATAFFEGTDDGLLDAGAGVGIASEGFGGTTIAEFEGFAVVVFAVARIADVFLDVGLGAFLGGGAAIEVDVGGGGVFFTAGLAFISEAAVLAFGGVVVEANADATVLCDDFAVGAAIGIGGADSLVAGAILEAASFGLGDAEADQASLAGACGVALLLGADVTNGTCADGGFTGVFGGWVFGDDFAIGLGAFAVGGVDFVGAVGSAIGFGAVGGAVSGGAIGATVGGGAIGGVGDAFFCAAGEFADEVGAFFGTIGVGLALIGATTCVEAGGDDESEHRRQKKTNRTRHTRFSFAWGPSKAPNFLAS